jgi:hypothetical protein
MVPPNLKVSLAGTARLSPIVALVPSSQDNEGGVISLSKVDHVYFYIRYG